MEVFRHEVNGWKQVKVNLNGEKYFIERINRRNSESRQHEEDYSKSNKESEE